MVGASKKRQAASRAAGSQREPANSHATTASSAQDGAPATASTSAAASPASPEHAPPTTTEQQLDGNTEPRADRQLVLNKNIDAGVMIWAHVNGASVAIQKRPAPSKLGREITIGLNTFDVSSVPKVPVYQYDVLTGNGTEKPALVRKLWASKTVKSKLPLPHRWIFDGQKIAYSTEQLPSEEIRCTVDLDAEEGRQPGKKPNVHRVVIKQASVIRFDNLTAFLEGRADFSTACLESINFLDHLLREEPSQRLTAIKRNFFQSGQRKERHHLGGGAEAFKGVYQSMRVAHNITGKHNLTVNVDVANGTFWIPGSLPEVIIGLLGCQPNELGQRIRQPSNELRLRRLRKVRVFATHRGAGIKDEYTIDMISGRTPGEIKIPGTNHTIETYMKEKYKITLKHRDWPAIRMTKKDTYVPLELLHMPENQRVMGKLDERQTSSMITFAVTPPQKRWADIQHGLGLLDWNNDKYLKGYGLSINTQNKAVKARLLDAPTVQFLGGMAKPGTSGRWDLKGKKFLKPNPEPLRSWGVCVLPDRRALDMGTVNKFVGDFMATYKGHGGIVASKPIVFMASNPDVGKAVEEAHDKTQAAFNAKPQILVFVLPSKDSTTYGRIKKSCECRYGVMSQCMQSSHVQKGSPQYISNVLMKFNAKLGGTTARAMGAKTSGPNGVFGNTSTMIVAADVTHPAPRSQGSEDAACSIAAVTTSMDNIGARYCARVETNGFRVEMIMPENWVKIWKPSVQTWMTTVGKGRLPQIIYYFRDGVSEGQFSAVIRQEVADMKSVLNSIDAKNTVKFVVIIATKRHHLRFFPPSGGDRNGNALPGTLVETGITHPYENDFFLCSHSALKGTARPTHYHVLINEPNFPNEQIQTLIYEHSYQYMRSTTPVSLFPAVYYADIAAERGRYHDKNFPVKFNQQQQPQRGRQESGSPSRGREDSRGTSNSAPSNVQALMPMIEKMSDGMWYI